MSTVAQRCAAEKDLIAERNALSKKEGIPIPNWVLLGKEREYINQIKDQQKRAEKRKAQGGEAEISEWPGCCAIKIIRFPCVEDWPKFNKYLEERGPNPSWMFTCPQDDGYKDMEKDMLKSGWKKMGEVPSKEGPYNVSILVLTFKDKAADCWPDDDEYYEGNDDR